MSSQLDRWTGEFGREYTDRNVVDWRTRVEGFRQMIPDDARTVLEVGCNRGHNLRALSELGLKAMGCEPAPYAYMQAKTLPFAFVCDCSVYGVGSHAGWRNDVVFTSGVLIHVPPERLDEALDNIYQASSRYILAIEYDGDDEAIDYRGHMDMLWRRNYGAHYTRLFPDLKLIDVGQDPPGWERVTWWLLQK